MPKPYQRAADERLAAETPSERAARGFRDPSAEAMTRVDAARIATYRTAITVAATKATLEELRKEVATQNVVVRDSLRTDWIKRHKELNKGTT